MISRSKIYTTYISLTNNFGCYPIQHRILQQYYYYYYYYCNLAAILQYCYIILCCMSVLFHLNNNYHTLYTKMYFSKLYVYKIINNSVLSDSVISVYKLSNKKNGIEYMIKRSENYRSHLTKDISNIFYLNFLARFVIKIYTSLFILCNNVYI